MQVNVLLIAGVQSGTVAPRRRAPLCGSLRHGDISWLWSCYIDFAMEFS
jgi:hypothetical protein